MSGSRYEIRIDGVLDERWRSWFEGLDIATADDTQTVISGPLPDQSALHGVLDKMRDLGLTLILVRRLDPEPTERDDPRDPGGGAG